MLIIGHVMIARSTGKLGDRIPLMSPLYHQQSMDCPQSSVLRFGYYLHRGDHQQSGGRLEVVALTKQRVPIRTLFGANSTDLRFNGWHRAEVLLPPVGLSDSLHALFIAVLGGQFVSDVMIDDVRVECVVQREWTYEGMSIRLIVVCCSSI